MASPLVGERRPEHVGPPRQHPEDLIRIRDRKDSLDEDEKRAFRQQVVSCSEFRSKEYPTLNQEGSTCSCLPPPPGEAPRRDAPRGAGAEVYVKAVDIDKEGNMTPYDAPAS